MTALYEIHQDILDCIDLETGEILSPDRLNGLQMERKVKIRNIACYIKDLLAEATAYETEEKVFLKRKLTVQNKAANLKNYLEGQLCGEKITDTEFAISWRKSQKIQIMDERAIPPEYRVPVPDKIDRGRLKEALKNGLILPGVQLIECNNIQIK